MGIAQEENLPQEHIEGDQNKKEDGERRRRMERNRNSKSKGIRLGRSLRQRLCHLSTAYIVKLSARERPCDVN